MSEDNTVEFTPVELEAKELGWVPKDDFNGNPDDWKDAETFMRRGKEINGFLRKENEKILTKLQQKDAEIAEIRATVAEFAKYHQETEKRAYERALAELKDAKKVAIEQSDGDRVVEIEEQIESLKEAQKTPTVPEVKPKEEKPALTQAEWQNWTKENDWYGSDAELTELAGDFGEAIKAKNPDLVGLEFLEEVVKKVKKARPDAFQDARAAASAVAGSGESRPSQNKKKTYNDLPADAKIACDRYVKQKLLTREQYVADYFDGE